jgi:hypothetical protein
MVGIDVAVLATVAKAGLDRPNVMSPIPLSLSRTW